MLAHCASDMICLKIYVKEFKTSSTSHACLLFSHVGVTMDGNQRITSMLPSPHKLCPAHFGPWLGQADTPPAAPLTGLQLEAWNVCCAPHSPEPQSASPGMRGPSQSPASAPH